MFQFLCKLETEAHVISKRVIFSEVAKLFDLSGPSGFGHCDRETHPAIFMAIGHPMGRVRSSEHTRWIAFRT